MSRWTGHVQVADWLKWAVASTPLEPNTTRATTDTRPPSRPSTSSTPGYPTPASSSVETFQTASAPPGSSSPSIRDQTQPVAAIDHFKLGTKIVVSNVAKKFWFKNPRTKPTGSEDERDYPTDMDSSAEVEGPSGRSRRSSTPAPPSLGGGVRRLYAPRPDIATPQPQQGEQSPRSSRGARARSSTMADIFESLGPMSSVQNGPPAYSPRINEPIPTVLSGTVPPAPHHPPLPPPVSQTSRLQLPANPPHSIPRRPVPNPPAYNHTPTVRIPDPQLYTDKVCGGMGSSKYRELRSQYSAQRMPEGTLPSRRQDRQDEESPQDI